MNRRTFIAFLGALPLAATAAPDRVQHIETIRFTRDDIRRACEYAIAEFKRVAAETAAIIKRDLAEGQCPTVIRLVGDPLTRRDLEQIFREIDKETRHQ